MRMYFVIRVPRNADWGRGVRQTLKEGVYNQVIGRIITWSRVGKENSSMGLGFSELKRDFQ